MRKAFGRDTQTAYRRADDYAHSVTDGSFEVHVVEVFLHEDEEYGDLYVVDNEGLEGLWETEPYVQVLETYGYERCGTDFAGAATCHARRTGEGYWTCDVLGGCSDCRTLARSAEDDIQLREWDADRREATR